MTQIKHISDLPVYRKILKAAEQEGAFKKKGEQALSWFRRKVGQFKYSGQQLKRAGVVGTPVDPENNTGDFFTFEYDPKLKDQLPYWDRFPFVLVLGPANNGFYGINFHYLQPTIRADLFQNLQSFLVEDYWISNQKIAATYEMLSSYSRFDAFRPCFKHYLYDHVGNMSIKIYPIEWQVALFLNIDQFQKMKRETVWKHSKSQIENSD